MHVSALTIFPVKSLQGISLQQSELTPAGLKWDRYWMIVNQDGLFMSQRNLSQMATIATSINDDSLVLSHPDFPPLHIPLQHTGGTARSVQVWKSECKAIDEGEQVSEWLTTVLGEFRGQRLSLVRMADGFTRQVSQNHTNGAENHTAFSDGYPILVTSNASLTALNSELESKGHKPVPMARFRGNIEVSGGDAFAEHRHPTLDLNNGVSLHLCKPCERCKVITLDQKSGATVEPRQPLKTLFEMQHVEQKGAFFGQNAVVAETSKKALPVVLRVGDSVGYR